MNQNKKVYLITYSTDVNFNIVRQRINELVNKGYIIDWWYYIDNTYLVASLLDANTLYNQISSSIANKSFLIIEVKAENVQGWLPQRAWNWILKHRNS